MLTHEIQLMENILYVKAANPHTISAAEVCVSYYECQPGHKARDLVLQISCFLHGDDLFHVQNKTLNLSSPLSTHLFAKWELSIQYSQM